MKDSKMNAKMKIFDLALSLLELEAAGESVEIETKKLVRAVFTTDPSVLNELAGVESGLHSGCSYWYSRLFPDSAMNASETPGEPIGIRLSEDGRKISISKNVDDSISPLLIWGGTSKINCQSAVFELEPGWTNSRALGRQLAAAPSKGRSEWLEQGVIANCGFVAESVLRRRRVLEVTFYVHPDFGPPHAASLEFSTHKSQFRPNGQGHRFSLSENLARKVNVGQLDETHLQVFKSLIKGGQEPSVIKVGFPVSDDVSEIKAIRLTLEPDVEWQLQNSDSVWCKPLLAAGDGTFTATRSKEGFGVDEDGVCAGYLLSWGQRDECLNRIRMNPDERIEEIFDHDAEGDSTKLLVYANRSLEKGNSTPLLRTDELARVHYVLKMARNIELSRLGKKSDPVFRVSDGLKDFPIGNLVVDERRSTYVNKRDELHELLADAMLELGVDGYTSLLNWCGPYVEDSIQNPKHIEFFWAIIRFNCIANAAEFLDANESTVRSTFNRVLAKLRSMNENGKPK